jgi:hypothetical protein
VQVLVATHSVDFVNLGEPDEIRICERSDDGAVQIESVKDKKDLAQALDSYRGAMGELWFSKKSARRVSDAWLPISAGQPRD